MPRAATKESIEQLLRQIEQDDIKAHEQIPIDPTYFGTSEPYNSRTLYAHVQHIRNKVRKVDMAEYYVRKLFRYAIRNRDNVGRSLAFADLIPTQEGLLFIYSLILDTDSAVSLQMAYDMLYWPPVDHDAQWTYDHILRPYVVFLADALFDSHMVPRFDKCHLDAMEYNRLGRYYNEVREMVRVERLADKKNKKQTRSKSLSRKRSPVYRSPVVRVCSGQRRANCRSPCKWIVGKGCRSPHY